ncbi:MAG: hypothetical protein UZ21_OP11001000726 [Microgenomates bacterium OLB22]|nr:MAG: hypothetical protein UZ21_OP11001000726 [Microgenomates bacterium OLB22]
MQVKPFLKRTAYFTGLLMLGILACTYIYCRALPRPIGALYDYRIVTLQIGTDKSLKAYVADTQYTRQRGLSGTRTLPAGYGLLFLFEKPGKYTFLDEGYVFES